MTEGLVRGWEEYPLDLTLDLVLGLTWEVTLTVTLEEKPFVLETDVEDQGFS